MSDHTTTTTTSSPLLAAINANIKQQTADLHDRAVAQVREAARAACVAAVGESWNYGVVLRAAVPNCGSEDSNRLFDMIEEHLAKGLAARLTSPPEPTAPKGKAR